MVYPSRSKATLPRKKPRTGELTGSGLDKNYLLLV